MPIHILTLLEKKILAPQILLFRFTKPETLIFEAGQYGGFTLMHAPKADAQGQTRRFSFLSTPSEPHLDIVTRIQNSFYKQELSKLEVGATLKFAGPSGQFTLPKASTMPIVMIAGGIGIAPFYSMIRYHFSHQTSQPIYLFYGNQSPESAIFLSELTELAKVKKHFHLIPTFDQAEANWKGERGFITDVMIAKYVLDLTSPLYYLCGSPQMVASVQQELLSLDIAPTQIKTEDFPGY